MTTDAGDRGIGFTLFQEVDGNLVATVYGGRVLAKGTIVQQIKNFWIIKIYHD